MLRTRYKYAIGLRRRPSLQTIATAWSRSTTAGSTTVYYTAKSSLLAKRRRWGMAVHAHHRSDTRVLYRVDDSRRSQQTCGGAAAAMIWPDHHQSRRPKELPNIEGLRKLRNKREHEGLGIGNENFCFNVFQWLYSIGST